MLTSSELPTDPARMAVVACTYVDSTGWLPPLPVELDGARTLVLAFASPHFADAPRPLQELAEAFPRSVLTGCSTAGVITGGEVSDGSISIVVVRFEHTPLRRAWTEVAGTQDSRAAGCRLAESLLPDEHGAALRAVFIVSDGLGVNGTRLVDGLTAQLPPGISISGGLAGDDDRFERTWVLDGAEARAGAVCAIGFYGDRISVGQGCGGGWLDFGPERRITRSEGNVLFELDDKPALELYKNYLGHLSSELPGAAMLFPLAIRRAGESAEPLVRTILAMDEARQSITFAGDVPAGSVARLMRGDMDNLVVSAGRAARTAADGAGGARDAVVISVSCVGRRLALGERAEEEVELVEDSTAGRAAHVGFYSYGEIARATEHGASELHNQTMTVTVIAES